jgi:hypothetical protein
VEGNWTVRDNEDKDMYGGDDGRNVGVVEVGGLEVESGRSVLLVDCSK